MRIHRLAPLLAVLMMLPTWASGQDAPPFQWVDVSVADRLSIFRTGTDSQIGAAAGFLQGSLTERSEDWTRAELDSLAAGITDLLLEGHGGHMKGPLANFLVILVNGRPVGEWEELLSLTEARLDGLPPAFLLRRIGVFSDAPGAVEYLVEVVTSEGPEFTEIERRSAIRGLARSESGRQRLRTLLQEGSVRDRMIREYLQRLAQRGFDVGNGGGPP